jgi:hypothetical protein
MRTSHCVVPKLRFRTVLPIIFQSTYDIRRRSSMRQFGMAAAVPVYMPREGQLQIGWKV